MSVTFEDQVDDVMRANSVNVRFRHCAINKFETKQGLESQRWYARHFVWNGSPSEYDCALLVGHFDDGLRR